MKPEAKVIKIKTGDYVRLLAGPPESVTMQSGAVTLRPGQSIGKHSTKTNEELLIVLGGEGTFILSESRQLKMEAGCVLYCPPDTEHDVKNTGLGILRYIFVVAKAE
jgi:quercetin dioxygenase-like cupin family protein